jgi:hypothetical protein
MFAYWLQSLLWCCYTSHQRSHSLRHSWRLPVTIIHFADDLNHTCLVLPTTQFSIILWKYPCHIHTIIDKKTSGVIQQCSKYVTLFYCIKLFTVKLNSSISRLLQYSNSSVNKLQITSVSSYSSQYYSQCFNWTLWSSTKCSVLGI